MGALLREDGRVPDWPPETYQSSPPVQNPLADWTGLMDWLVFLRTRLYVVGAVRVLGDTALPATAYDVLEHMYVCCSTELCASCKAKN